VEEPVDPVEREVIEIDPPGNPFEGATCDRFGNVGIEGVSMRVFDKIVDGKLVHVAVLTPVEYEEGPIYRFKGKQQEFIFKLVCPLPTPEPPVEPEEPTVPPVDKPDHG